MPLHETVTLVSTQLDAVNAMLSGIGEAPVNSLTGQLPADVAVAINTLNEILREVQLESWHFNTEDDYPLLPDDTGEIILPLNVVRVSLQDPDTRDVVQRGQRLYDRANHTYRFNGVIRARVSILLPFDELPEAFRWYVTVRAARKFQDRTVGAGDLHDFQATDEAVARVSAVREDMEIGRHSLAKGEAVTFLSGWRVADVLRRRP